MAPPLSKEKPQTLILLLLASFASVLAVLFTPALPELAKKLNITSSQAQFTITIFLIGYAIGNLPYGPLANRFGRKPVLYGGLTLALIGTLITFLGGYLHLFWLLLIGRFLSALGASVGLKMTFTMIGDAYSQSTATKKISGILFSFAIAPAVGIAIGGFLTDWFGWESCFVFSVCYTIFIFFLSCFLPETGQGLDLGALNLKKICTGYAQKFKNSRLVTCSIIMGCTTACAYLFAAQAPFIGIDSLGLTPEKYGLLNFIPPLGILVGSALAHQLVGRMESFATLLLGIILVLLITTAMLLLFLFNVVNLWTLFLPMPFLYIGSSLVYSNASSLGISHAKNKSNAAAVLNFFNMGTSTVAVLLIQKFPSHEAYILPLFFVGLGLVMLLLYLLFLDSRFNFK